MLGMIIGVVAVLFVALPVLFAVGVLFVAAFSGVAVLLVAGIRAGSGILPGIVLGYVLYRAARKNRTEEMVEL